MSKVSDCCGAEIDYRKYGNGKDHICTACGKPCTIASKPDASPDLLTDKCEDMLACFSCSEDDCSFRGQKARRLQEEANDRLLDDLVKESWEKSANDKSTFKSLMAIATLAFEAGKKAQKEQDQHEIAALTHKGEDLCCGYGNALLKIHDLEKANAEAKKQGAKASMIDIGAWADQYCRIEDHVKQNGGIVKNRHCLDCWSAKIKEIGL